MPKGIPKNGINKGRFKKGMKPNPNTIKASKERSEEKNPSWVGDSIGIKGVHQWVNKWNGKPKICEVCGTIKAKKYEWANVDHTYKRILEDYIRMCTSCHRKYDIKNNNYKR